MLLDAGAVVNGTTVCALWVYMWVYGSVQECLGVECVVTTLCQV